MRAITWLPGVWFGTIFGAASAFAEIPWPPNGAPVCTDPGDQRLLVHGPSLCAFGMRFGWFGVGSSDSLVVTYLTAEPPTGDCGGHRIAAASDPREVASATIRSGLISGIPGCFEEPLGIAWIEGTGARERVMLDAEAPLWNPGLVVDEGAAGSGRHGLAMAGARTVGIMDTAAVLVWTDDRFGVPQIRAQAVGMSGERLWGPSGVLVAPTGAPQDGAELFRLPDGSSLVAWRDLRSGTADVFAQRLLADGTPAPGWPVTGWILEGRSEISGQPRFAPTASPWGPEPIVVWVESGARFAGGRSIVARRLDGQGLPVPAWPESGVVLSDTHAVEALQAVRAAEDGNGLVVLWTDVRNVSPANGCDLYAQRIDGAGARVAGWLPGGNPISLASGRQDEASLDLHPSGIMTVGWVDDRSGAKQVYAALRNPDGSLPAGAWLPDGLPAGPAAADQRMPVVEADNGGGLFVVWLDHRNEATTGVDVYAQAFTYDGRKADVPPRRPGVAALLPAWPNPFRTGVRFVLDVPARVPVRLDVVDATGRRVRELADHDAASGRHEWIWDGRDDAGRVVAAGLYFVTGRAGETALFQRVIRVR